MKVYLSHVRADSQVAEEFRVSLRQQGLRVWDPQEDAYPGDNVLLRTGRQLQTADAFVLLMSPAAAKSPWIQAELDYALGNPKFEDRVYSVVVKPTDESPWILGRLRQLQGTPHHVSRTIARELKRASTAS